MLPLSLQFTIAIVACAINERMARRLELIIKLARENLGWGYIRDALRGLRIEIGRSTVADIFWEAGIEPAPERIHKRTWKQSPRRRTLYACDFFAVETLGMFGTVRRVVT